MSLVGYDGRKLGTSVHILKTAILLQGEEIRVAAVES
jgi:hypothetical protein